LNSDSDTEETDNLNIHRVVNMGNQRYPSSPISSSSNSILNSSHTVTYGELPIQQDPYPNDSDITAVDGFESDEEVV